MGLRLPVNRLVAGSNPARGAKISPKIAGFSNPDGYTEIARFLGSPLDH
jgi:hypothetical protein